MTDSTRVDGNAHPVDPPRAEQPAALLIHWNASRTHAEVRPGNPSDPSPPDAHRLLAGESYYGIPFHGWSEAAGQVVDVLELQARWQKLADRERRTRPVSLRVLGDDWRADSPITAVPPPEDGYGFVTGKRAVACTREQLIRQCVEVPETPAVWTPETGGPTPPEQVPYLVEALRARRQRTTEIRALTAGATLLATAAGAWAAHQAARPGWIALGALAAAWWVVTLFDLHGARRPDAEGFAAARQHRRYAHWIGSRPAVSTRVLMVVLAAVMAAQWTDVQTSIEAAGLVKERVRDGEAWRLLTGALLHGGALHLGLNLLALWSLGPLVEAHAGRSMLPVLFVASALVGSLTSLYLLPDAPSVGASGGILGLAGFLFVFGYRRRGALPPGFPRRVGLGILATAVFGIVGHAFVDNATHLGGALTGMLLAGVSAARLGGPGGHLRIVGGAALLLILVCAVASIALILGITPG